MIPSRPEFALHNLAEAYNHKDSTAYKGVFDDTYQASYLDQKDPSPQLVTYYKDDEARHIAFLAKSNANVDMRLSATLTPYQDLGDPPGWMTIQVPFQSIAVSTIDSSFVVNMTQDYLEMRFIPHTPDASSPTDTSWKVIKLTEVRR